MAKQAPVQFLLAPHLNQKEHRHPQHQQFGHGSGNPNAQFTEQEGQGKGQRKSEQIGPRKVHERRPFGVARCLKIAGEHHRWTKQEKQQKHIGQDPAGLGCDCGIINKAIGDDIGKQQKENFGCQAIEERQDQSQLYTGVRPSPVLRAEIVSQNSLKGH